MKTPELNVSPNTNYGTLKYLLVVGYMKTTGVTIKPYLIDSQGKEKRIEKLIAISPVKKMIAYFWEISPVVRGRAFVRSTCLSISLSAKSLITHPADLVENAPIVNSESIFKLGIVPGAPNASPQ